MIAFSKKHEGMPLHVAVEAIGCSSFLLMSKLFLQTEVDLPNAILHLNGMFSNILSSLIHMYGDKTNLHTKSH